MGRGVWLWCGTPAGPIYTNRAEPTQTGGKDARIESQLIHTALVQPPTPLLR